ncbi:MAG TPA: VTT domain-containing protein [Gemmatimonas sp.]|nr:VTT domain-containing protein [Gemmatimonas sp.]
MLEGLSDSLWAYIVLGFSAIVTEELSPIFAGIAVHEGELRMDRVLISLSLGGWIATTLLYALGRLKWDYIRRRFPKTRATGTVALRIVARNPVTASLLVRFAFGLRIVLPIACGAARVPLVVYLPASLVGSIAWSVLFTLIGFGAGEAAVTMVGKLGRVGEIVGALVVTLLVFLFMRWNSRRNARKAEKRRRRATNAE